MTNREHQNFLILFVLFFYAATVTLVFCKVYIFHSYPIFYDEDDIPSLTEMIFG